MKNLLVLLLVVSFNLFNVEVAKAGAKAVCITSTGSLVVKTKCNKKKGELKASAKDLASKINSNSVAIFATGEQGETGDVGPKGETGDPGNVGVNGTQGLVGSLNLESCREVEIQSSNLFDTSDPTVVATASCNTSTEYMLDYGYKLAFPNGAGVGIRQAATVGYTGTKPTSIEITGRRIPPSSGTARFDVFASAVCCKPN